MGGLIAALTLYIWVMIIIFVIFIIIIIRELFFWKIALFAHLDGAKMIAWRFNCTPFQIHFCFFLEIRRFDCETPFLF